MGGGDVLLTGGEVIDGTGRAAFRADVRVRGGVIAEIGPDLASDHERVYDASGAVVAPGFIDSHAHTDATVFWNPALDPEPLHGVTTMLIGNCGLSLFPVHDRTRGTVSDLFSYVEDVPRHLFDDSVPWTWRDCAGYREVVDAMGAGTNLACLVGHPVLRLFVMGDDAWTRRARDAEIREMAEVLDQAMRQGAWGLSLSHFDRDPHGRTSPTLAADGRELDALLDVLAQHGHGICETVPNLFAEDVFVEMADLAERCGTRNIPLTWTGFVVYQAPETTRRWLDFVAEQRTAGRAVYPQLSPRTVDFQLNWDSSLMFMAMPTGWHRVIGAPAAERAALLRDENWRAAARDEWDRTERGMFPHRRPDKVRFVEVYGAENHRWLGRTLADLIAETGEHPSDALADFALANECRPGIVAVGVSNTDVDAIARTYHDPSVIVSSSDAGAHLQMLCASGDTTLLLIRYVRERGDFTLERAIHELTGRQSEVFGFRRRGVLTEGNIGDLVVFALDELHYDGDEFVSDLPEGGRRLRRPAGGYRATFVNGTAVQTGGILTGELPGRVISAAM